MTDSPKQFRSQRRAALKAALGLACVPCSQAIAATSGYPELSINLYNLHTRESLQTVFWADGHYDSQALLDIDVLLRDHRTGDVITMDTRLLSIIYLLGKKLDYTGPISVISGYRSAATNRKLAMTNSGVAKNSYHVKGQAIDLRINGRDTSDIRDIGHQMRVGGVGYYPKSNFVHLDTGPWRHW